MYIINQVKGGKCNHATVVLEELFSLYYYGVVVY